MHQLLFPFFFLCSAKKNPRQQFSHKLPQDSKRKTSKYQLMQTFWKKLILFTLVHVTDFNISWSPQIANASLTSKHWVTAPYFRIYLRVELTFEKKQMQLIALSKQCVWDHTCSCFTPYRAKEKKRKTNTKTPQVLPTVGSSQLQSTIKIINCINSPQHLMVSKRLVI